MKRWSDVDFVEQLSSPHCTLLKRSSKEFEEEAWVVSMYVSQVFCSIMPRCTVLDVTIPNTANLRIARSTVRMQILMVHSGTCQKLPDARIF